MKTEIMIAVLALLCIGSLAAAFVLWAKLDEQRKATAEAEERRWDEISRAASIEKDLELEKQYFRHADAESFEHYQNAKEARMKCEELQDRLSAPLCPTSNHIWKDGVCVKCGRVKDALP